jgi:hypothetical protein
MTIGWPDWANALAGTRETRTADIAAAKKTLGRMTGLKSRSRIAGLFGASLKLPMICLNCY